MYIHNYIVCILSDTCIYIDPDSVSRLNIIYYRLKELLRTRLRECGWRDQLKEHCRGTYSSLFVLQVCSPGTCTSLYWFIVSGIKILKKHGQIDKNCCKALITTTAQRSRHLVRTGRYSMYRVHVGLMRVSGLILSNLLSTCCMWIYNLEASAARQLQSLCNDNIQSHSSKKKSSYEGIQWNLQ